jgi:hypothetical protein
MPLAAQSPAERTWTRRSLALDWSGPDRADRVVLTTVLRQTLHAVGAP